MLYVTWYNYYRPHMTLNGRTPVGVFEELELANEKPRIEPRPKWPQESLCASPQAAMEGYPGAKPVLEVAFLEGCKHLPIVRLREAS